jgi:hypothetical protein
MNPNPNQNPKPLTVDLSDYAKRKSAGMISATKSGGKGFALIVRKYTDEQLDALAAETQMISITLTQLQALRTQRIEAHQKDLADLDAMIADLTALDTPADI